MTCLDFENRVQELLDQRQIELPVDLSAHAAHCAACHELWGHLRQVHLAAESWRSPSPNAALADAVLQRVSVGASSTVHTQIITARPACSSLAGVVVLFASAATLLIALGIGWRVSSNAAFANRQPSPATVVAAKQSETIATPVAATDRQLDVLLHDARDAYLALASQAWQEVSTTNVLFPPADASAPFRGEEPATSVPETLSRPLEPYGRELRDAVDSWLQQVFQSQDSST